MTPAYLRALALSVLSCCSGCREERAPSPAPSEKPASAQPAGTVAPGGGEAAKIPPPASLGDVLFGDRKAQIKAAKDAMTLHRWLIAACFESDGKFPAKLESIYEIGLFEKAEGDAIMPGVIEYRGKGLSSSDDVHTLLLRYRAGKDHEVRVELGGEFKLVPSSTPLPPEAE